MEIFKKRIRNLETNLRGVASGETVVVAYPVEQAKPGRLEQLGFTDQLTPGESVLPTVVGPVTRYNAEGRYMVHRDQPKETCYRQVQWSWTEHHGQYEVEQTDFKDVPYERYPRTFVSPPSIELTIVERNGVKLVATPELAVDYDNPERLRDAINVVLEAFRSCQILRQDLEPVSVVPDRRLNWEILPQGRMPWKQLKPALASVLDAQSKGNLPVVEHRLETVNQYGPEFVAVGRGGFGGYLVFGFPELDLYVLECTRYGNATYVLRRNWEYLSRLTKAEILDEHLHHARYVHLTGWAGRIDKLLRYREAA